MSQRFTILLVVMAGIAGYLTEPLLSSYLGNNVPDTSRATPIPEETKETETIGSFTYVQPEKAPEPEQQTPTKPEPPKVTAVPEKVVPPVDDTPAPKVAFPITSLKLDRPDKGSTVWSPNLEQAIVFAVNNDRFADLVVLLEKELYKPVQKEEEISPKQLAELHDNPAWNHAINVYTILQLFTPEKTTHTESASQDLGTFYIWLLTSPEALSQLLYNLTPQDDLRKALTIMELIWSEEALQPEMRIKYLNLAIACALVFDKAQIKPKNGYETIEPLQRYSLFKKNAEAGRLKTVLSKLKVADLVWVVDVPVTDDEIEWAIRHANFSRRNWGRAYGHIEYLMERAVNGENPYTEYTFAQIQKHGGICGDQTYFAVNTAKANGIPAAGVSGSGDRGGHAWLAYKPNSNEWDTTTGRYENYSNGQSRNSQTNLRISEFDFMLMSDRKMREYTVQEAETLLRFVPILINKKHASIGIRQTLEEAVDVAPLHEDAWSDYIAFLEQSTPTPTKDEWQKIIDTIERTFKKHPTMWMTARALTQKHIWKELEPDKIESTQSRYRSEIARKFPDRGDLIRKVIGEQADMLAKQDDFKAARSFYRQAFRLFGEDTLNFRFIADRYFNIGKQYPEDREQICDDIESYFSRTIDQESGDFFKAKTEISMLRTIAKYYEQIGNDYKANKYSKEAQKRAKKSSKRAL